MNTSTNITVTYRCGHSSAVAIEVLADRAEALKDFTASIDCPNCLEGHEADFNDSVGMAQLEGTKKQIAWAEAIRAHAYINLTIDHIDHKQATEVDTVYEAMLAIFKEETSAHTIIKERDVYRKIAYTFRARTAEAELAAVPDPVEPVRPRRKRRKPRRARSRACGTASTVLTSRKRPQDHRRPSHFRSRR